MSEPKRAIDMTQEELDQWIDSLEIEDEDRPEYLFSNPDPYFKITPTAEPKNKNFWFGEDGHIHVKNISAYWIPEFTMTQEIAGTVYKVSGSYEGTESFTKKIERMLTEKLSEKLEDDQ